MQRPDFKDTLHCVPQESAGDISYQSSASGPVAWLGCEYKLFYGCWHGLNPMIRPWRVLGIQARLLVLEVIV